MDERPAQSLRDIADLREESETLKGRAPGGGKPEAELALAAWARADQLAEGVLRLSGHEPLLPAPLGMLGRALWEDAVTMDYVRQKPGIRMRQLLVSALEHHEAVARSQWGKEAGAAGIGQKERAFVRAARAREGKVKAEWRRRKQEPLPVDQHAGLPSLAARARAVGAFDQYQVVYQMESRAAVHFGLPALFERPERRLLESVTLAAGSYRVLLASCAALLDMPEHRDLLEPFRREK